MYSNPPTPPQTSSPGPIGGPIAPPNLGPIGAPLPVLTGLTGLNPLQISAKPFYPAYSSPHLKNITTFAETRLSKSFGCFVATFAGFSCFPSQVGIPISSPVVDVDGHLWSVRIYACGVDESATGFISCYLVHESEDPVRAAVKITLINAKFSSDNHIAATDTDKMMPGKGATIGWAKFIHQTSYTRYCLDDVLVLRIDLTLFTTPKMVLISTPRRSRSGEIARVTGSSTINDSLAAMLFDASTADVHFQIDQVSIPAHRFILSMRSEVLKKMCADPLLPVIQIEAGIEPAVIREMIRFIYTDQYNSDVLRLHYDQLLTIACRFQVLGLMHICANHMYSLISAENVSKILRAADACNAQDLRATALAYIVKYAKDVVQHADFFENLTSELRREVILALANVPSK